MVGSGCVRWYPAEAPETASDAEKAWTPKSIPMRSAYATASGKSRLMHRPAPSRSRRLLLRWAVVFNCQRIVAGTEPEFTNFAKRAFSNGEEFCETLDYIWLSDQWQVEGVVPLPSRKEVPPDVESFPSASEPSDHMLIGAQLSLPAGT